MRHHCCFASADAERLLAANGVGDFEAAFRLGQPVNDSDMHYRRSTRHEHKCVVQADLTTGLDGTMRVYIKRQWRRSRWLPRPTDIRHGIAIKCSPIHEWRGLRTLQEAGFHVAEPLALFWQGWGFSRGAIITRAVPPQSSLADLFQTGEFDQMALERRRRLIEATANVVAGLHRARIAWRSMKAKHFYPEETAPGNWRIWLIDCEGVSTRATPHDRSHEWSSFLSFVTARAPKLREAFLAAYMMALTV